MHSVYLDGEHQLTSFHTFSSKLSWSSKFLQRPSLHRCAISVPTSRSWPRSATNRTKPGATSPRLKYGASHRLWRLRFHTTSSRMSPSRVGCSESSLGYWTLMPILCTLPKASIVDQARQWRWYIGACELHARLVGYRRMILPNWVLSSCVVSEVYHNPKLLSIL